MICCKPIRLLFFLLWSQTTLFAQSLAHEPGAYLVSLQEGLTAAQLQQHFDPNGRAEKVSDLLNIWLLHADLPEAVALNWLREQPEVRLAQYNHLLENRGTPNDPLFPQQWQLHNNGNAGGVAGADIDAVSAWDITTGGLSPAGDTIVIAVIDGGVQYSHPDLAPNLWHNWAEIPNNGLDDDGNGYVDDFRGWNVFAEDDNIEGSNTTHGTPVSAILGARGDNGLGVTGVNWHTKVMFVAAGGTEASILAAYDYVRQARLRYNDTWGGKGAFVVAVNCSWGINYGQPAEAPLWCEAFDQLGAAGIVSVAATANLPINVDESGDLPTACPSNFLIGVTSLNSSDKKAENAAWGVQHVDLGAYGQEVYTAEAGSAYGYFSGTSFAAPQVTGALGLLYAAPCPNLIAKAKTDPAAAAYWAKSLILESVHPNASLEGKTLSNGRLNVFSCLKNYESLCSDCPAPFALKTELQTDTSVWLLWSKSSTSIYQNLRWRRVGVASWNQVNLAPDTFLLTGLSVCQEYEFELQSICENGQLSAWSQPLVWKTKGCCSAPGALWVANNSNYSAEIAWEPSSFNQSYRLRWREKGALSWEIKEVNQPICIFENLSPCTLYEMQVQARCEDWLTDYSSLFTFHTVGCGACNEVIYCLAKAEDATEEWISSVRIGNWLHPSAPGGNGYQNFSFDQMDLPVLRAGYEVSVALMPGFSGAISKEYFRLFVDYNQDGDFADPDELAFDPGFALEGAAEGLIHVPNEITPGITRMRVMMKFTTSNDIPPGPCSVFGFGQVEDYCIELQLDSVSTAVPVEVLQDGFKMYPQPAFEGVMLEFPEVQPGLDGSLLVVDIMGRTLTDLGHLDLAQPTLYLDMQSWPSGVYALQIRVGDKVFCRKLIKG